MSLFVDADCAPAHLRALFMGGPGSGKTFTACEVAIGLVNDMKKAGLPEAAKPVYLLDSDGGSDWIAKKFRKAGIKLRVAKTKAFADLLPCILDAEKNGSVLIIDGISSFADEFEATYTVKKKRDRGLEFSDHAYLKREWRQKFVEPFLNADLHVIACGRSGFEYDTYTDETGKKQIEKGRVKVKAIDNFTYEPSLVVLMESVDAEVKTKGKRGARDIANRAQVLKDRRPDEQSLSGKTFLNPTYKTFLPHISALEIGAQGHGVDTSRTSSHIIEHERTREADRLQKEIVLEEIQGLLVAHYPGQAAADKKAKQDLLVKHFGTRAWVECEKSMSLEMLRAGYDSLHRELEARPSRYGGNAPAVKPLSPIEDDGIPNFDEPPPRIPATHEAARAD
jgi:hypothetical protein